MTNPPEGEGSISTVIKQLIELSTLQDGKSIETKVEDITQAARASMNKLLSLMSVLDFIDTVNSMLGSGDTKVRPLFQIGCPIYETHSFWVSRFKQVHWKSLRRDYPRCLPNYDQNSRPWSSRF